MTAATRHWGDLAVVLVFRVAFGLACGVVGFCAAGLLASELMSLPEDGLAAAARVATFSSLGGVAGIISGALLGRRVDAWRRVRSLLIVTLVAAALVAAVSVRGAARRRARAESTTSVPIAPSVVAPPPAR